MIRRQGSVYGPTNHNYAQIKASEGKIIIVNHYSLILLFISKKENMKWNSKETFWFILSLSVSIRCRCSLKRTEGIKEWKIGTLLYVPAMNRLVLASQVEKLLILLNSVGLVNPVGWVYIGLAGKPRNFHPGSFLFW